MKDLSKLSEIIKKGRQIINFIENKYNNIKTYNTEYFEYSDKVLKIIFNYEFYVLYDFDKITLIEIDYYENETDITNDFVNYCLYQIS